MYILGISAFYHDSAACLLKDGQIVAAAQEERFTRVKHDHRFPKRAIDFCLKEAGISVDHLDYVSFYEQSGKKFDRLFKTYLMNAPKGCGSFITAMPVWFREKLWINKEICQKLGFSGKIYTPAHHVSHAASAFLASPFEDAAIIVMDGVGEWATCSFGTGSGNTVDLISEIRFPHSLGLLYSAFTYFTGFKVNSGEYKLMGLAPYGAPRFVDLIYENLIDVKDDGSFRLNMDYFDYCTGFKMTSAKFSELFGREPRKPESEITKLDMDLAASIQKVTEDVVLKIAHHAHKTTSLKNLCLAGGVALNCVANGRLYREGPFENIWVQPAAGDAGGALGAALHVWHHELNNPRKVDGRNDQQAGSYLGTGYMDEDIEEFLVSNDLVFSKSASKEALCADVAGLLAEGKVVGWFSGRMEFGPRALGARSILGDPRSPVMQRQMNLKIKFRESFRPFAPAVLEDALHEWFDMDGVEDRESFSSPYMLMVGKVDEKHLLKSDADTLVEGFDRLNEIRSAIPAVTHVDNSARLQSVHKETNPDFHALIGSFHARTGCPILINTSFNVRGEPIVESPEDAYRCFMRTEMDYLVLGSYVLARDAQAEREDDLQWMTEFELD